MNQSAFRAEIVRRAKSMRPVRPKFAFGKYKGKTLEWVLANSPGYIVWVHDNVAKSYWPSGFDEAYRLAMVEIKRFAEEEELEDMLEDWETFHE